jgi:hypothetical protein
MIHENLLRYRGAKYFWWSLILLLGSIVVYVTQRSDDPPNGGTWQGYVLGTIGALLIVWLALLGIRKRRYRSTLGSVQGWTSAHVYLGTALLIVATLHTAGQFAWNVHTLSYVLMCIVIFSGFFGAYAYMSLPRSLRGNRDGRSREQLFAELYDLNEKARALCRKSGPDVQGAVLSSIERTAVGGGAVAQLLGADGSTFVAQPGMVAGAGSGPAPNPDQRVVIELVAHRIPRAEKEVEAENLQALLSVLSRRQAVLRRIRADIRLQAWLQIWLYVHIPFTVALLGALAVHILTTYIYW